MSKKHPVIAVTGSSGAGTTTVKLAFEHMFFRKSIKAAVVEGDSLHSLTRSQFNDALVAAEMSGEHFSHFGPEANHFDKVELGPVTASGRQYNFTLSTVYTLKL